MQVSPLFQKLEAEQIEALKKRFGGQQVSRKLFEFFFFSPSGRNYLVLYSHTMYLTSTLHTNPSLQPEEEETSKKKVDLSSRSGD